jgi:hypothetical protein
MKHTLTFFTVFTALLLAPLGALHAAEPRQQTQLRDFITETCVDCHGPDVQKGKLRLDMLALDPGKQIDPGLLARLHDRVRDGEMPPKKAEQPTAKDRQAFLAGLGEVIKSAEAKAAVGKGRTTIRRMSRVEFENTLEDLLSLPVLGVKDSLPEDGRRHGFDRVGESLELSAVHMQKYLAAADRALRLAAERDAKQAKTTLFKEKPMEEGTTRSAISTSQAVPLVGRELAPGISTFYPYHSEKNPGTFRQTAFDGKAESVDSVALLAHQLGGHHTQGIQLDRFAPPVVGLYKVRFSTWGLRWERTKAVASVRGGRKIYMSFEKPYLQDPATKRWTATRLKESTVLPFGAAGAHSDALDEFWGKGEVPQVLRVSISGRPVAYFDAPSLRPTVHEVTLALRPEDRIQFHAMTVPMEGPIAGMWTDAARDYEGPGVAFDYFEVEGPLEATAPPLFGTTAANVLASRPGREKAPSADILKLMREFASRAFRRPVDDKEAGVYAASALWHLEKNETYQESLLAGYKAILCSPDFLFIGLESGIPPVQKAEKGLPARLGDYALASRLSYFLWDSMPDGKLLDLAAKGTLSQPKVLQAEVERMLADKRSDRFVEHFLDEWLNLRNIEFTSPDPDLYPDFDPWLQHSTLAETRASFRRMLDQDRGVRELIASDTLLIDERLALLRHSRRPGFGVAGSQGSCRLHAWRLVDSGFDPPGHRQWHHHFAGQTGRLDHGAVARTSPRPTAARGRANQARCDGSHDDPRGIGQASRQRRVCILPQQNGSLRLCAGELRPHRRAARQVSAAGRELGLQAETRGSDRRGSGHSEPLSRSQQHAAGAEG